MKCMKARLLKLFCMCATVSFSFCAHQQGGVAMEAFHGRQIRMLDEFESPYLPSEKVLKKGPFGNGDLAITFVGSSYEHESIGEEATNRRLRILLPLHYGMRNKGYDLLHTNNWPAQWKTLYEAGNETQKNMLRFGLSYGEISALCGDFYLQYEDLLRAPLEEIYHLVSLIHGNSSTDDYERATGGRYLRLAKANYNHFTNVPLPNNNNEREWKKNHSLAIKHARRGGEEEEALAWGFSACGTHYLTDAFASGHMRLPRFSLQGSRTADLLAKIIHDQDNQFGLLVKNDVGQKWMAFGDERLLPLINPLGRTNHSILLQAIRTTIAELVSTINNHEYNGPFYQASGLIPRPIFATADILPYSTSLSIANVLVTEGPSYVLDWSDSQMCAYINQLGTNGLRSIPSKEKAIMMQRLMEGWVSARDLSAIKVVIDSFDSADSLLSVVSDSKTTSRFSDLREWKQRQIKVWIGIRLNQLRGGQ